LCYVETTGKSYNDDVLTHVDNSVTMGPVRLKPQDPGPDRGLDLGPPGTTKIYKVGLEPLWAPKCLEGKLAVF